jgi:hypothetical protein
VAADLLLDPGNLKVLVGHFKMLLHLLERLRRDGLDTELPLRLCEQQPEPAPLRVARALPKEACHLRTAVSRRQRRLIRIVGRRPRSPSVSHHFELGCRRRVVEGANKIISQTIYSFIRRKTWTM